MTEIIYREVEKRDIPALAAIRSQNSGTEENWHSRITGYLACTVNPRQSLEARIIYVTSDRNKITGFIAGHLSGRYGCDGELEWIDVIEDHRRKGIGSALIRILAKWFAEKQAYEICVDPGNDAARKFYKANGAKNLNNHWMYWNDIRVIL